MIVYEIADFFLRFALIISAVSILIFNFLVISHFFNDRREEARKKRKDEMRKKVFLYLNNPISDLRKNLTVSKSDISILTEVAADLLRNLKGKSYNLLLEIISDAGVYEYIKHKLFSKNVAKYSSVIGVSSHLAGVEIKQRLIELLEGDNYFTSYYAAESLAYTHDPELLQIVIQNFTKRPEFSYKMIANIFYIFGEKIVPEMIKLLKDQHISNRLKKAALLAVGQNSDYKEINQVAEVLCDDKDDELRSLAFAVLADAKAKTSISLLEKGAQDNNWKIRQNIARCAIYNFPLSATILADLLKDKNWLVGLQAAKSLIASGLPGRKILESISQNNSLDGVRAKMIIAESGSDGY